EGDVFLIWFPDFWDFLLWKSFRTFFDGLCRLLHGLLNRNRWFQRGRGLQRRFRFLLSRKIGHSIRFIIDPPRNLQGIRTVHLTQLPVHLHRPFLGRFRSLNIRILLQKLPKMKIRPHRSLTTEIPERYRLVSKGIPPFIPQSISIRLRPVSSFRFQSFWQETIHPFHGTLENRVCS